MRWRRLKWLVATTVVATVSLVGMRQLNCQSAKSTKPTAAQIVWVWWEGEKPAATNFPPPERNPFAPLNEREASVLSEGRWIGITGKYEQTPFLEYEVNVPQTDTYHFFVRKFWKHGPFRWRFDDQSWQEVPFEVSLLDEEELRTFIVANWIYAGQVQLTAGKHRLRIEQTNKEGAASYDCFLLINRVWIPKGKLKPNERVQVAVAGWSPFDPDSDIFSLSPIDLRSLNEKFAGEKGFITVKGDQFVHNKTGEPVRFWGVNAGPDIVRLPKPFVDYLARHLAKLGVNIVRVHGSVWRSENMRQVDTDYFDKLLYFIAAMKREGIYTGLSVYFPLWLRLSEQRDGFAGYKDQHPFALLFFNRDFQEIYKGWWRTLLTTPNPYTGVPLKDEPAVAYVELVNEDSYLFWTFNYDAVPAPQMEMLEREFAEWLERKYGSLDNALQAWNGRKHQRDDFARKRVGFLHLWEIFNQKDKRCQDTAEFLAKHQREFFAAMVKFIKSELGYKGLVVCSNWITADERTLGPLDKWSNLVGDFMDRHGYFGGVHKGERAGWAISVGDLYNDLSALTLPVKEPSFSLPVMDICYNNKPSIISEINWTPPNRFRAEFPVLCATYGALQGSDGFFFFALNGPFWQRTLSKFAIQTPTVMGQFPACSLIYRKGLLKAADAVVKVEAKLEDLFALKGVPVRAPINLDELRAKDIPAGGRAKAEQIEALDPLAFFVGRVVLNITEQGGASEIADLSRFIDRSKQTVTSATGELVWDYGRGVLLLRSPMAQGAIGFLGKVGRIELPDATIEFSGEYGSVIIVAMDDRPIRNSQKILVQVVTEEQNNGWQLERQGDLFRIAQLGSSPLLVRNFSGTISLRRPDAFRLRVTTLDANGYPLKVLTNARKISLTPDGLYYLVTR
ncbi:MAG: hypothetical protein RMK89_05530 [Armatimonadota bacterium]|nr:hypothetical protein [Armatimonadota bacterium]MDW8142908.1 hypothetical protein [Armatimonadota bacterium]